MKRLQNERKVLVSALYKAENDGYSNIILNSVLSESELSFTQKAFVTAAFYGVLERKITIDFFLNKYLKKPVKKAPPYTAAVLRSGAYQILFMEKVPNSAAVNESVKLIKKSAEKGNGGLVNAVLRKLANEEKEKILDNTDLSVKYSVEPWILKKLENYFPKERVMSFLENSFSAPPVFITLNTTKDKKENILEVLRNEKIDLFNTNLELSFKAKGIKNIEKYEGFKKGLYFVQDFSSFVCASALKAEKGMRVLDCCAAPGGKSFATAVLMEDTGEIVSCDVHKSRVNLIKNGAERLNLTSVSPTVQDGTEYNKNLGEFDRVLCDVPCSGMGVIRRKPEIKYKSEEECIGLPYVQLEILKTAAKYLKKGGRMVYSTCTVFENENIEVVNRFLKENPNFVPVNIDVLDINETNYTFLPPQSIGDGFFIAVFERK